MFDKKIQDLKKDIIRSTCDLINIPSVYSENSKPTSPFGDNIKNALNFMLSLATELGFRTKNIDGYCGYIEFGEGEELLGIIGHLDVVPADDNWTYNPFKATIADNKIYGRGAIDDKGPVISALYAMKAVMDSCKVSKRVRLILGTNEERDWKCIDYYKDHEEIPTLGFSPDADFPCIYAEKGLLTVHLIQKYIPNLENYTIIIKDINYYNNAINVVPKQCDIKLLLSSNIDIKNFISDLKEIIEYHSYSMDIVELENNMLELKSYGVSAHAAHPDLGINATSHLLIVLQKIYKKYGVALELLDFFANNIGDDYTGKNLEINIEDESGILTLNTSQLMLENNELKIGLNLRIPIKTSINDIKTVFNRAVEHSNIQCIFSEEKDSLYVSKQNPLVKTLCNIYNEYTNSNLEPIAIGGATYARAFPNCISFGANLPGHKDMCHQVDEYITIDNLILASKIYAQAIYELAK